jgi:predicted nucleotidyltransferase
VLSQEIPRIAEKYNLKILGLFGSYGTEYYNEHSGIDPCLFSEASIRNQGTTKLIYDLILAFRKSEIDLVELQTADYVVKQE